MNRAVCEHVIGANVLDPTQRVPTSTLKVHVSLDPTQRVYLGRSRAESDIRIGSKCLLDGRQGVRSDLEV